jgi:hypothetical protein
MILEYILLLGLFVFVLMGSFNGDKGPAQVFKDSAPRLGARVEQQLSTGQAFNYPPNNWTVPNSAPPTGMPQ